MCAWADKGREGIVFVLSATLVILQQAAIAICCGDCVHRPPDHIVSDRTVNVCVCVCVCVCV